MAQEGPSTLPTYYGEKTTEGRVVKRPSDEETLLTSPPANTPRDKGPQHTSMPPFESGDPRDDAPLSARTARWTVDDAKRDEYWRGYWDRRRPDRDNRDWYPEYRGPQRYLEMDDDRPPARGLSYRGSKRDSRAPTTGYRGRRSFDDDGPPPPPHRRHAPGEDDDYDEDIYTEDRGHGRQPPRPPPPGRTSLDSDGEPLRLPLTQWMNTHVKGRKCQWKRRRVERSH
jgi:hypothetical protein